MKLRLTGLAEHDLRDIGDFIAQDAPRRALTYVRELREACTALTAFPLRCPIEGEVGGVTIRRLSRDRHNVFYALNGDEVVILRVLEGSRDHHRLFGLPD